MTDYLGRLLQRAAGETPTEPLRPLIQSWSSPAIPDAFEATVAEPELDPGSAPQPAPLTEPSAPPRAAMPRNPASPPAIPDAFETTVAEPELDPGSAPQPAPPTEPPAQSRAVMPRNPTSSPAIPDAFEATVAEPGLDPGSAPQPAPLTEPPAQSRAAMPRHPASSPAAEPDVPPVEELPAAKGPLQRRDQPAADQTFPSHSTRSPWARSLADAGRGQIGPHQDLGVEIVRPRLRRPGGRDRIPMAEDTAAEPRPVAGREDAETTSSAPQPPTFEALRTECTPSLEPPRAVERPRSEAVEAPAVRPKTQALGQKEATYREPAPLLQPPSPRPLQPQAAPPEQPRLVIGNLRVEVVPAPAETSRPQPVRTVQRVRPAQQPSSLHRRSSKLRFGLGQM